jgi:hypothetical protein
VSEPDTESSPNLGAPSSYIFKEFLDIGR